MGVYPGIHGDLYQEQNENLLESPPLEVKTQPQREQDWKRELHREKIKGARNKFITGAAEKKTGQAMEKTGKAARQTGRQMRQGGVNMVRTGVGISTTGVGALAGVPLAIAGAGVTAGGALTEGGGLAAQKKGQMMAVAGEKKMLDAKNEIAQAVLLGGLKKKIQWSIILWVAGAIASASPIILILLVIIILGGYLADQCRLGDGILDYAVSIACNTYKFFANLLS